MESKDTAFWWPIWTLHSDDLYGSQLSEGGQYCCAHKISRDSGLEETSGGFHVLESLLGNQGMNRNRVVRSRSTVVFFFICLFVFREKLSLEEILSKVLETQHQCYTMNHMGSLGYLNSIYFVAKCFICYTLALGKGAHSHTAVDIKAWKF